MATPVLQPALTTGEISPSLFGRVDIDKERIAASTMRNAFVNYRGGCNSRAGTKFVGFSKQTGRDWPPRLIPFQFSINQGLVLEFGNEYMRVISDGAFVTETPVGIGGATQADPCVLTFGSSGAATAAPITSGVTLTYAPGDLVTLAGGTYLNPAILEIQTVKLLYIDPDDRGTGYSVADTITLGGGTATTAAIVTVATVTSVSASGTIDFIVNPVDGDTVTLNGVAYTFKDIPAAATDVQIEASLPFTIKALSTALSASTDPLLTVAAYAVNSPQLVVTYITPGAGGNAYTLAASSATPSGATLTGGTASGIGTVTVTTAGNYSAAPVGGLMTQSATSGGGAGASFQTAIFGPLTASISNAGAYSVVPSNPVAQLSTTGIGLGATFTMTWTPVPLFSNGDWIYVDDVVGMTELNGNVYVIAGATATTVELRDVYGNNIDSTGFGAYVSGGTAARIFTLDTPYAEEDLAWLKVTQSADVLTICCVNQLTGVEYEAFDLARNGNTDWTFESVVTGASVAPPTGVAVAVSDTGSTNYAYVITAISPEDGSESTASGAGTAEGASIATEPNTQVNITWNQVESVSQFRVYKAQPSEIEGVQTGALFGYIGLAYGQSFVDHNVTPDFTTVPPQYRNPFDRGRVLYVTVVNPGTGYPQFSTTAAMVSGTGAGAVLSPVVVNGSVVAIIIVNAGYGYLDGDTVVISGGTGATAVATIGPSTGTYPSVPGYFQQRRVLANSLNSPDTYWMSEPGSFNNFDVRIPSTDSDAIEGSPWSVQVNGIQWLVQTAGGLLAMTGSSAWLLVGQGSFATNVQAFGPSSQAANPQPFSGVSPSVPPLKILFDIVYVTAKGSYVFQLPYQGYAFSEPIDLTQYATHLFIGHELLEWAWCEQPFKLVWAVRDDGTLLSLSYLKAEQVYGWARHDTNGYFVSSCQIVEPPVDALYVAVQRFPGDNTAYMIERMDDRLWATIDDTWCVDSGLRLAQVTPAATLRASSAFGLGAISGATIVSGGAGYSASTTATITDEELDADDNPIGSGATASVTVTAGVITSVTITNPGSGYRRPSVTFIDPLAPAGGPASPASATLGLDTSATFTASSSVFVMGDVGSVIRMGGGVATITGYTSGTVVTADITTPISALRPNTDQEVRPAAPGEWTLSAPVSEVSGLMHLAGATVTGIADGNVIPPTVVSATGTVTLATPASAITIGLGFQVQVQTVPIDVGVPTVQGQRKKVAAISAYVENSRSVSIGQNQQDGSTLSPPQIAPTWMGMEQIPDVNMNPPLRPPYNSTTTPLGTGWVRTTIEGGWAKPGQIAVEQNDPLPLNVVSLVPELVGGDTPGQSAGPDQ